MFVRIVAVMRGDDFFVDMRGDVFHRYAKCPKNAFVAFFKPSYLKTIDELGAQQTLARKPGTNFRN